jgi:hypothetical protein
MTAVSAPEDRFVAVDGITAHGTAPPFERESPRPEASELRGGVIGLLLAIDG